MYGRIARWSLLPAALFLGFLITCAATPAGAQLVQYVRSSMAFMTEDVDPAGNQQLVSPGNPLPTFDAAAAALLEAIRDGAGSQPEGDSYTVDGSVDQGAPGTIAKSWYVQLTDGSAVLYVVDGDDVVPATQASADAILGALNYGRTDDNNRTAVLVDAAGRAYSLMVGVDGTAAHHTALMDTDGRIITPLYDGDGNLIASIAHDATVPAAQAAANRLVPFMMFGRTNDTTRTALLLDAAGHTHTNLHDGAGNAIESREQGTVGSEYYELLVHDLEIADTLSRIEADMMTSAHVCIPSLQGSARITAPADGDAHWQFSAGAKTEFCIFGESTEMLEVTDDTQTMDDTGLYGNLTPPNRCRVFEFDSDPWVSFRSAGGTGLVVVTECVQ